MSGGRVPFNAEGIDRNGGTAAHDQFGKHFADGGADLESRARQPEGMEQSGRRGAGSQHRVVVGHVALHARPEADDLGAAQRGQQLGGVGHQRAHVGAARARIVRIHRHAAPAADHAVAARDLPCVDAAALHAQAYVHEHGQRFGDHHQRMDGGFGNGLAEAFGKPARPGARAVEQEARAHFQRVAGAYDEARAVVFRGGHAHALAHIGAQGGRGTRKGRRHQPRVGVAVFGAEGAAGHLPSQPAEAPREFAAPQDFQVHAEAAGAVAVGFQQGQVGLGAGQLQVTRTHVLAVDADQFLQLPPQFVGTPRQGHLLRSAPLPAHPAVVHAAGLGAAQRGLQQHHGYAQAAQEQRGAAADDAAADDGNLGIDPLDHADTFFGRSRDTTRTGTGLTGGWLRSRPTSAGAQPTACASTSAAAAPHMRP
ncbi:hypothetical protein D3C72_1270320 [compost metagenome]